MIILVNILDIIIAAVTVTRSHRTCQTDSDSSLNSSLLRIL